MSVQVEKLEHNMAKLTITVPAETFDKAITQAYKKMKNQISIPGFRKGKVPQAMVEKMYGAGMFYEDAANIVIPDAYDEALAEVKDITITSQPSIDIVQINKGQEFIFTAEVAVKPEVTLGQYKGIEVPETVIEVTDEEIAAELKKVQEQNAREISVDRPAESGDTVVIDYEGSVDGELFDGGTATDHPLVLGSNSFIPGFEDQLIGATADSDVDVHVTFPEEYHAEDLAGKEALFKVKVHEVKRKELPEINDEFAQDVSEFDTLEEYKADVKKGIADKKADAARQEKQEKIISQIVENAEMDIPDPMVTTQARQMMDQFAQQMQYNGLSMAQYYQFTGLTPDGLLEQMKPQALKNIQNRLVLEAIAKAENYEASEEEVEAEFAKLAEKYNMTVEKIKEIFADEQKEGIKSDLAAQKALDLITDAAVEVPVAAVEATVEDVE
ncbi:MAG: trigger factor [Coprococcus sp.]